MPYALQFIVCQATDCRSEIVLPFLTPLREREDSDTSVRGDPYLDVGGRGRPWKSRRSVLNGVLWVLRTGAPWADLPDRYPSFQTCHRRFQQWVRSGVMTRIMTALARELNRRGTIDVREAFIDASFAPAKKGGTRSEKRSDRLQGIDQ
jgi:transposase